MIHSKKDEVSSDLIGSWTVHVGDMDQCLHLWKYTGGFEKIDTAHRVFENDKVRAGHERMFMSHSYREIIYCCIAKNFVFIWVSFI